MFNEINVLFIGSVYFRLHESKWISRFEIRIQKSTLLNKCLPFSSPCLSPWHFNAQPIFSVNKEESFII